MHLIVCSVASLIIACWAQRGGVGSPHPFKASFGDSPAPFMIDVDHEFIQETLQRVRLTRSPGELNQPELVDGPPVRVALAVRDHWIKDYDWFQTQHALNDQFTQFTTTVSMPADCRYTAPVPLHFIHHKSDHEGAIPLLFIHGWPGSFLEVGPLLPYLLDPPNASAPAFHVVAPSIPGFAFSPAPTQPGFGYIEAAHAFDALMRQLGYSQYVLQAGDAGGLIMRYQAHLYPSSVVSGLNNFWVVSPEISDLERYHAKEASDDEVAIIERMQFFISEHWGYGQIQQTRPLRLAHALTDSPVGLAIWIYDGLWPAVWDLSVLTAQEIITWTMMHWIQGPYGALSIYKQGGPLGGGFNATHFTPLPYVHQPMAISEFPKDLWYRTPLEWTQRTGNVKVRYLHETGGHFPAWENPELLAKDIWSFFGDKELSGMNVFQRYGERKGEL
ncbi:uncharacterized protein HMPREF1541_10825 [Cyphellophora europaea CBS 101466]|uniref:Epoxide hydrolase N-terminal domain-containing protein n=1 Tax=Cyphellophora europaea (strain CBS 101466) TaxID=1220924 RepID=W2S5S7_CYPE1|nr:uncharacterized protein HMPREF1541_10825 [Cyphellophora europaea CBS 101466]ETN43960.1 hypothetical protein HMPREF1541_10825 [Cyphellophora europaea CBS 101466]